MGRGRVLLAAGLALFAAGLLIGFLPRSAGGVSCGSAFVGNDKAEVADLTGAAYADLTGGEHDNRGFADRCADSRSAGRIPAFALLAAGGVLAFAGVVTSGPEQPQQHPGVGLEGPS